MPLKIYYRKSSAPQFWDEHWKKTLENISLEEYYSKYMHSQTLLPIFEKYLPKQGKIIEAGCGLAQYIYLLRERGYDIEGIDLARETVNFVNSEFPQLPVRAGNVFHLDYPDNTLEGYISLAVIENFEEGQETILREAYRALDKRVILILSVPYFNPLRRIKKCFGFYRSVREFYQYAFTRGEIEDSLVQTRFKLLGYYYDAYKALKGELSFIASLLRFLKNDQRAGFLVLRKKSISPNQKLQQFSLLLKIFPEHSIKFSFFSFDNLYSG